MAKSQVQGFDIRVAARIRCLAAPAGLASEQQRATCYGRLGLAREALALWEQIIPDMPASARRDVGVFRVRQAQALAAAGEPEQAVAIVTEVVPVALATGSARMTAELSTLREGMAPWRLETPGRALDEMLANVPQAD